jgi:hypothetical protein
MTDTLCGCVDGSMICYVELDRHGMFTDLSCCGLAPLKLARTDQNGKAASREVFGDLKAYPPDLLL